MSKLSNIYYPTGELRGIYNKTNGLKDGLSYEYDKDQDVYIIRNFKKGKFHGESIIYIGSSGKLNSDLIQNKSTIKSRLKSAYTPYKFIDNFYCYKITKYIQINICN
jgi:antitoxin component YwqK of YwqJK toxin-antitoxin module